MSTYKKNTSGRGLSKKVKVKIWMDYPNIFCKSCSWINLREACRCNSMQEWSFTKTRTALNEWKGSWSVDALICRDKWKLTPVKVKVKIKFDGRSWSVDTLIDLPAPVICERKSEIWFVQWMLWFVSHHSGRKFPWYVQMISVLFSS